MVARAREFAATVVALLLVATGCGQDEEVSQPDMAEPQTIAATSRAFSDGERIPATYTCDHANISPPLDWDGVPADAHAVALVLDDPDAPSGTFTHWVVLDLEADVSRIDEDAVPAGGVQAQNSARRASYFGPCPPSGTHRYRFTVYALRSPTGLADGASLSDALSAIDERVVAWGRLTGVYPRS